MCMRVWTCQRETSKMPTRAAIPARTQTALEWRHSQPRRPRLQAGCCNAIAPGFGSSRVQAPWRQYAYFAIHTLAYHIRAERILSAIAGGILATAHRQATNGISAFRSRARFRLSSANERAWLLSSTESRGLSASLSSASIEMTPSQNI